MRSGFYGYGFNVGTTSAARTELSHSGAFELGAGPAATLERLETRAPGQEAEGDFASLANANLTDYAAAAGLNASFDTLISRILPAVEK